MSSIHLMKHKNSGLQYHVRINLLGTINIHTRCMISQLMEEVLVKGKHSPDISLHNQGDLLWISSPRSFLIGLELREEHLT